MLMLTLRELSYFADAAGHAADYLIALSLRRCALIDADAFHFRLMPIMLPFIYA